MDKSNKTDKIDKADIMLSEKDMLTEAKISEKHLSSVCNGAIAEMTSANIKNAFLNILNDIHNTITELNEILNSKGWHTEKIAEKSKISEVKNMFSKKSE